MALKAYKPTSPARRGLILVDKSSLWKGKPVKALTEGKRKTGGRNNKGHVTSRGIAGGHKQKYRIVDFKRRSWDVSATVERLEYDPNRSAFIALVTYDGGEQAYILAPQRLAPGDKVVAGKKVEVIEFFMYHCPVCNALEPQLEAWAKQEGDRIQLRRIHIPFRGASDPEAHLFLALEAMGKPDATHGQIFDLVHKQHVNLHEDGAILDWMGKNGAIVVLKHAADYKRHHGSDWTMLVDILEK